MNALADVIPFSKTQNKASHRLSYYRFIITRCDHLLQLVKLLSTVMTTPNQEQVHSLQDILREDDAIRFQGLALREAIADAPLEFENIYRSIISIDKVLHRIRVFARQIETMNTPSNSHALTMAQWTVESTLALCQGYRKIANQEPSVDAEAQLTRDIKYKVEECYIQAVRQLLGNETSPSVEAVPDAPLSYHVHTVHHIFSQRELYRLLLEIAEELAVASLVMQMVQQETS